ncbi:MAG: hypothetical protein JRJ85_12180 [Deltaproteobacteria bacterium]|nr:hypothetical protein [Deltaproteobacteria bacterium]
MGFKIKISSNVTNKLRIRPFTTYSAEYQAILDSFSTAPSSTDATAQNTFVTSLVNAGVWSELDRLFILAAHASGADSLLDWIHPTGSAATLVNDPSFVAYQGYKAILGVGYINTNYKPATDGINYTLNDACHFGYSREITTDGHFDLGQLDDSSGNNYLVLSWKSISGEFEDSAFGPINCFFSYTMGGLVIPANVVGMKLSERVGSNNLNGYVNGELAGSDNEISTYVPTLDQYLLCHNDRGTPSNASQRQLSMYGIGGSLGATKQLAL